ncbi:hypothetical protein BXQ17_08510 [Polaribacter sp. BM10]|uniref:T9SS type B sorting domain-containing protein n=1 Tax=Polaribacter sp. BM10 TaxID=1529069 RepID=UPI00098B5DCF|nr:T9SS type B sorting domain-containing protein [Polaribacter sp. BM10]AQS94103.1 hypothetical protein BXQ17_08510 [Polaribacter sp. BM10]
MKISYLIILLYLLFPFSVKSQITLTHNIGNKPIKTDWVNCEEEQTWARVFNLEDYGISTDDQFIIKSGQTAISNSKLGSGIQMSIFIIDENFPNSNPIYNNGSYRKTPEIGDKPEILSFEFSSPIVIPAGVKKILVTVNQTNIRDISETPFLIAGTKKDKDTSWFYGCKELSTFIETENLDNPKPNANFFINVTGKKIKAISSFNNKILSHNTNDVLIETQMHSCSSAYQYWARNFKLSDFGISNNEEYIIHSGQVGINEVGWQANLTFNIYKIDDNFPNSFSEKDLIGSSQTIEPWPGIGRQSQIINIEFETPITVPAGVERILVEVKKGVSYGSALAFIAGTENDKDDSWYKGCGYVSNPNEYRTMNSSFNYFITVNGEAKTILPFEITNDNTCSNFSNNLSLTNKSEIKSVIWNFDDPSSSINNTSTKIDVNHQFTNSGIYNVTATVTHIDNTVYTIPKEIEIFEAPNINQNVSLKQCDNSDINGFSFFNLNEVKEKIVTNPENYTITFHEDKTLAENKGIAISNVANYENNRVSSDTIWARVENSNGCFDVSEVDLLVSTTQIPINFSKSFYQCDNGTNTADGIAIFDFSEVTNDIINIFPSSQQLGITYYKNEEDALAEENAILDISNYENIGYPNEQKIYIRVDSKIDNNCLGLGSHISLNVEKTPVANPVTINPECDNDRDGFYSFDTSTINSTIIGSQTNVTVSYFDESGNNLSSPLPNPFITKSQKITARVENSTSKDLDGKCYEETILNFVVNSVPIANSITPIEKCDNDYDGIASFDTSKIESTILGSQTNLIVRYFDENNKALPSPLPNPFITNSKKIKVILENPAYDACSEETEIRFIVNQKPVFNLISNDIICMNSDPSLNLQIENPKGNYTYVWRDDSNNIIGNTPKVVVKKGGNYKVIATSLEGCASEEKSIFVKESGISTININNITVQDDSDNNFIKVNSENLGLGEYEFRLLDKNYNIIVDYQNETLFDNLDGGVYILELNDKNGCGSVLFEVALISFPNYFTPNGDNFNDFWQIKGIDKGFYKSGVITIFNRFGKQLSSFTINDLGWDGTYNGKLLASNNYWYRIILTNHNDETKIKTGNFSLLRK